MRFLDNFLAALFPADMGKLILRLSLGGMMLFHGYKKAMHGIGMIKSMVVSAGFPEALAYGVYVGEIVAPILIIIGLYTRLSALIFASTMAFAIYLAHASHLFGIDAKTGGLLIETPLLFMMGAISLMFIGGGRYSADGR